MDEDTNHQDSNGDSSIGGLPQYGIGNINLTQRWFDLVQQGKVVATTNIQNPDAVVEYGIRIVEYSTTDQHDDGDNTSKKIACMEFVQQIVTEEGGDDIPPHPVVQHINITLSNLQSSITSSSSSSSSSSPLQPHAVEYTRVGDYVAQLQFVRTLRPPPSSGFAASGAEKTTCHPPPYDRESDSFVQGPYRLELRPIVGSITRKEIKSFPGKDLTTDWDIYHNVSPADSRGHYLLLPTLSDPKHNWRGQILTSTDCQDIVTLTSTIQPIGSALVCYNSVGATMDGNVMPCPK